MPNSPLPEWAAEEAAREWYEIKYGTKTFHLADPHVQEACRDFAGRVVRPAAPSLRKQGAEEERERLLRLIPEKLGPKLAYWIGGNREQTREWLANHLIFILDQEDHDA